MQIKDTPIDGLLVLEPQVFGDDRGSFCETYKRGILRESLGYEPDFMQDNQSVSTSAGTLRGLHLQREPHAQAKLVRCISGRVWDVAVDMRDDSATYGEWYGVELSADNGLQFFIPRGFAHGFLTLEDDCVFVYKVDHGYAPDAEITIAWDDPTLGIQWPIVPKYLSAKDQNGQAFTPQNS